MAIYLGSNQVDAKGLVPGNQLGYMGNAKLIAEKTYSFLLSDTNYSSLTISTSSQALDLPATTYTTSPSSAITVFRIGESYDGIVIDKNLHDYLCIGEGTIVYKYTQSDSVMNGLIHGVKTGISRDYQYGKCFTIASDGSIGTSRAYGGTYLTGQAVLLYRKTDGTYATTTSRGVYTTTSPTIDYTNSTSGDYLNLTLRNVSAMANENYFPLEAMNYIDPTKTTLTFTWHIYEGDDSAYSRVYRTAYSNAALS